MITAENITKIQDDLLYLIHLGSPTQNYVQQLCRRLYKEDILIQTERDKVRRALNDLVSSELVTFSDNGRRGVAARKIYALTERGRAMVAELESA